MVNKTNTISVLAMVGTMFAMAGFSCSSDGQVVIKDQTTSSTVSDYYEHVYPSGYVNNGGTGWN